MKHLKIVFMGGHHHTNAYSNKMISTAPPAGQRGTNITLLKRQSRSLLKLWRRHHQGARCDTQELPKGRASRIKRKMSI